MNSYYIRGLLSLAGAGTKTSFLAASLTDSKNIRVEYEWFIFWVVNKTLCIPLQKLSLQLP